MNEKQIQLLKEVGRKVKQLREQNYLSLRAAARAANIPASTWLRMERGAHDFRYFTLLAISKALFVQPQEIVFTNERY